jgi:hypothetical protein
MTPNQPWSRAGLAAPYLALCAAAACGGVPRADERPPVAAAAPAARCRPGHAIKRAYDPDNRFTCHHCVGSEGIVP